MYVSRLCFHTLPGKTHLVEAQLKTLSNLVKDAGGASPRILRTHFASMGAPDIVFEQQAEDLAALETQIRNVTEKPDFKGWSAEVSEFLREPPKREVLLTDEAA
jgi:hypothetical protein